MGIGDIGWSEFIFLFLLALILLGPRRLPEIANALGRSLREFRRALNEVQDELRRESGIDSLRDVPWNRKFDSAFEPKPSPAAPAGEQPAASPEPEAPPDPPAGEAPDPEPEPPDRS